MQTGAHGKVIYYPPSLVTSRSCLGNLTYVKSPVASLCFVCSSVKKRVSVIMSVLTASPLFSPLPLDAMLFVCKSSERFFCWAALLKIYDPASMGGRQDS
jgi:hypothetical protein